MLVVDSVTGSEVVDTLNVVFVVFSGASTTVADVASVEFVGGVGVDGSNGSKMRGVDTAGAVAVCISSFVSVVGDCGASPCASVETCTNGVVYLLVFVGVGVGVNGVGMELMNRLVLSLYSWDAARAILLLSSLILDVFIFLTLVSSNLLSIETSVISFPCEAIIVPVSLMSVGGVACLLS